MSLGKNSEQEILVPRAPRRQDARDLQSRLYREIGHYHAIGVAAVEAELFGAAAEPLLLDQRVEPAKTKGETISKRDAA